MELCHLRDGRDGRCQRFFYFTFIPHKFPKFPTMAIKYLLLVEKALEES